MATRLQISEAARELFRQAADIAQSADQAWLDELDVATLEVPQTRSIADDPVLSESLRRSNRSNLAHWATANVHAPGARVDPNLSPEILQSTRDLVRRGLSGAGIYAYRAGQDVAWLRWMEIVFSLSDDASLVREVLDVSARSISDFIDVTIEAVSREIARERGDLLSGTHAERREVVALLLAGAPISRERAESRLGYRLDQPHTAAVIWSDLPDPDPGALEAVAESLMASLGAQRRLNVIASAATLWVWIAATQQDDPRSLGSIAREHPDISIAIGTYRLGLEGFRRTHLDAIATQRMLARLQSPQRVATFANIELTALVTSNSELADEFVTHTLGPLATAEPRLQDTVRAYLHQQSNLTATAAVLHTHRNTALRRISRAEAILPRPLAENSVSVAVALDILHWRK